MKANTSTQIPRSFSKWEYW